MFRKEAPLLEADLTTPRAERMLTVYQPATLDVDEIRESGTVEPCFVKVRRFVEAGTTKRLNYLQQLLELWVAVLEAGHDTEKVVVFAGTPTHYDRVRFINGQWGAIPAMKRPQL